MLPWMIYFHSLQVNADGRPDMSSYGRRATLKEFYGMWMNVCACKFLFLQYVPYLYTWNYFVFSTSIWAYLLVAFYSENIFLWKHLLKIVVSCEKLKRVVLLRLSRHWKGQRCAKQTRVRGRIPSQAYNGGKPYLMFLQKIASRTRTRDLFRSH